jgi:PAS domain S-box-containing protein
MAWAILDAFEQGIAVVDTKGNFMFVDSAFCEVLERNLEQLVGTPVAEIVHPEDQTNLLGASNKIASGEGLERKLRLIRPSGEAVQVRLKALPHSSVVDNSVVIELQATGNLEPQPLEGALRDSTVRYQMLADYATDMISVHDAMGRYRYASPACHTLLGYTPEELKGKDGYIFFHPDDIPNIAQVHSTIADRDSIPTVTVRLRRKDGSYGWFEINSKPIRNENSNEIIEIVAITRDITERKAMEEQLRTLLETLEEKVQQRTQQLADANERLRELNRLKTKFIADVTHELRTPATAISLQIDLLKRGGEEKREGYLGALRERSDRLNDVIESILQFSELSKTVASQPPQPIDLNQLVQDVVDEYERAAGERGLTIDFSPGRRMPAIMGIAQLLSQALGYLVDNAIKYTPTGRINISTFFDERKRMACVQIQDTGIGIEENELPHVFRRLYRGQQVSQSTVPGAGLGLPTAQHIALQHEAEIRLESEIGVGTTAYLWLKCVNMTPDSS